jgi:hypothetical protein
VSTDPGGRPENASFVGAKTVNGPDPFKVPAISAAPIAVRRVVNRGSPESIARILFTPGIAVCVAFTYGDGVNVAVSVAPGEADFSATGVGTTVVRVVVTESGELVGGGAELVRPGIAGVPLIVVFTAVPAGIAGEVREGGAGVVPRVTRSGPPVVPVRVVGMVAGGWEVVDCRQPAVQRDAIMSISTMHVIKSRCMIFSKNP